MQSRLQSCRGAKFDIMSQSKFEITSHTTFEILSRCHACRVKICGHNGEYTLFSAAFLADAQRDSGMLFKALALRRETLARMKRVCGDTHERTLGCQVWMIAILVDLIIPGV